MNRVRAEIDGRPEGGPPTGPSGGTGRVRTGQCRRPIRRLVLPSACAQFAWRTRTRSSAASTSTSWTSRVVEATATFGFAAAGLAAAGFAAAGFAAAGLAAAGFARALDRAGRMRAWVGAGRSSLIWAVSWATSARASDACFFRFASTSRAFWRRFSSRANSFSASLAAVLGPPYRLTDPCRTSPRTLLLCPHHAHTRGCPVEHDRRAVCHGPARDRQVCHRPQAARTRTKLWPIVDARPQRRSRLAPQRPGQRHAFDAVNHVFKRWSAHREAA